MTQADGAFLSTRWSLVARAAAPDADGAREALEELCRGYWWPLYVYTRRLGLRGDDAADLVQGFFTELIEKGRLVQADPARGRFRCWLLSALKFHLAHERDRERTVKRGGRATRIPLDKVEADRRWAGIARRDQEPDRLFERAWATAVLERAVLALDEIYARAGRSAAFNALKPVLLGEPTTGDMGAIATRLGMSPSALKAANFRLRRSLGAAIRSEVGSTLDDGGDVEEELRAMFAALSAG